MEKCMLSNCSRIFFTRNEIPKTYEVTLPDYCQGIKKVIKTDVIAVIENASYSDGLISEKVALNVRILYVSDQNAILKSVAFPFDFEHGTDASKINISGENPPELDARVCVIASSAKPKGARTIEIKLNIALSTALYRCGSSRLVAPDDHPDAELRTIHTDASEHIRLTATDRPLKEEITLDSALPAAAEIADYTLSPMLTQVICDDGCLKYSGTAMFKCTYRAESSSESKDASSEYIYLSKEILFSGEIASEKVTAGGIPCASAVLTQLDVSSSYDPYGESRVISISSAYDIYADVFSPYEIEYTDDGYCSAYECEFEKTVYDYSVFVSQIRDRTEISEKISSDKTSITDITDTSVYLSSISCEDSDGAVSLACKASVFILGSDISGMPDCLQTTFNVKFPLISAGEYVPGRHYFANPSVPTVKAVIADGEIMLTCDIDVTGAVLENRSFEAISGAEIFYDAPKPICRSEYIIYYPDKDETLWDIAKKYEIPRKTLANANGMESEELKKKTILIPCAME